MISALISKQETAQIEAGLKAIETIRKNISSLTFPQYELIYMPAPPDEYYQGDVWDKGYQDEKPIFNVDLEPFYMGETTVTFEMYDYFCEATGKQKPDDMGWGRGQRPVIYVNWFDCLEFCNWLSIQDGYAPAYEIGEMYVLIDPKADGYRLPNEEQWEYAASWDPHTKRKTLFGNGDFVKDINCLEANHKKTMPVKYYPAGNNGFFQMSGNTWEWCENQYFRRDE